MNSPPGPLSSWSVSVEKGLELFRRAKETFPEEALEDGEDFSCPGVL